ncbi:deoxynucleoside kinase [Bacillus pseudomycoides]|nr:deoxynucleoside kinase [Bacillus pseudomycoides]
MALITVAGFIGAGKSSLTEIIAKEYNSIPFYEKIDSPLLSKLYQATPEEKKTRRIPFLLQLEFLNNRFSVIKHSLIEGNNPKMNVLDRSIYEDWYFAKVLYERGEISSMEFELYENLLNNMMEELEELPKKAPDLMIYIKGSFETFIKRIQKRGRGFELDKETEEYFYELWSGYDDWLENHYHASPYLIIDADKYDYVENEADRVEVLEMINIKLWECGLLEPENPIGETVTISKGEHIGETGQVQEVFKSHDGRNMYTIKVEGKKNLRMNFRDELVFHKPNNIGKSFK